MLIVSFANAVCIFSLATALLNLLESKLPSDFNKKFGLSWNLVKASVGSERGRRKFHIVFSRNTPPYFFSVTLPLKIPERNLSVYSLSSSEPIVEIKVSTPISVVVPRFKVTLNLMACIANHKPFEEGEFPTNALVNIFLFI